MRKIEYCESTAFKSDMRKLLKKFKTLTEDLEIAKRNAIELFHNHGIDNQSVFKIPKFCNEKVLILKLRKFACRLLKGRGVKSGIRIIYAYHINNLKVEFIQIYFKSDHESEDQDRIRDYLKNSTD